MINHKNKNGFTLIELLIVIGVVAVISLWAIRGYTQYRKSALLNLSADSFVSQVYELKDATIHGFGDKESKCLGIYFQEDKPVIFSQEFADKKVWNEQKRDFVYTGCVNFQDKSLEKFELDPELSFFGDSPRFVVIRYAPPNGKLEISMDAGLTFQSDYNEEIQLILKYGKSNDPFLERNIFFNPVNGRFEQ